MHKDDKKMDKCKNEQISKDKAKGLKTAIEIVMLMLIHRSITKPF
jgi:hypothetical protein